MIVDTNVFLDVVNDDGRVGPQARAALSDSVVLLSTASTWEIAIKARLGRLRLPEMWEARIEESGFVSLPVLLEHSVRIGEIGALATADPFDRLLLTQAFVEGEDFFTFDRSLLESGLDFVVDARR